MQIIARERQKPVFNPHLLIVDRRKAGLTPPVSTQSARKVFDFIGCWHEKELSAAAPPGEPPKSPRKGTAAIADTPDLDMISELSLHRTIYGNKLGTISMLHRERAFRAASVQRSGEMRSIDRNRKSIASRMITHTSASILLQTADQNACKRGKSKK